MLKLETAILKLSGALFLAFGLISAATLVRDLSQYRDFRLGTDLASVAKLAGVSPSQAKTIQLRPALIQELAWRPQPLGWSSKTEAVKEVVFSFYNDELFRIAVSYDRYETEGLTADDIVGAIAATYGIPTQRPGPSIKDASNAYGAQEDVLAEWQDPQFRFDLIRVSYGPAYRLVGILKRLEAPVQAATLEAKRLDDQEAPERDAARIASQEEAAKAKLEKARLVNKPKFRP